MTLSIGGLAERTGETIKALRYWTNSGLLEAERGDNGYRYYCEDMAERCTFIRSAQALGFTLSEVLDILALRASGVQPCDDVRERLMAHLATVRARIAELGALENDLEARLSWAEAHPEPECHVDGCVYLTE